MAGKKNGTGGTKGSESASVVAAIRDLGARIEASVGTRIDKTNERIDTLVTILVRQESRLDEIARNTR